MKPGRTLLPLLTVAVAGVGVTSAQFVTSTTTAPDLAQHSNNAAALSARGNMDTVRTTRTVSRNSRTTTRSRTSSTKKKNDDDDDDDNDNDEDTTTQSQTSPTTNPTTNPTTKDSSSTSTTPTSSPSNDGESRGGGLSAGAAAGITAAAVTLIAIAAAVAFLLWRRRQGGIRGAVVTADYPRGMDHGDEEPKLPPEESLDGQGGGQQKYPAMGEHGQIDSGAASRSNSGGSGETLFQIPPAGTMPGEPGFEDPGDYPLPPAGTMPGEPGFGEYPPVGGEYHPQQQQQQQYHHHYHHHHQYPGGDLGQPRPVSAFTAYPSPGQPVFPVSPMTPWRPESSILQQLPPPGRPQSQAQSPAISSYFPSGAGGSSPGPPPAFLVPGGDRSRAVSFSSVAQVGGGPGHVAELVGSPPLPPPVPSFAVVVEDCEPARGSQAGLPP